MASHELVTAPIARLGVIPLPYTKPHPLAVHDQSEHTHRLFVSLVLFFSLSHPKVKNTKVKSGDMDSQYHFPKVKMLVKKKSFFSKDSTDLYTIPNQSKKVLGGLP